MARKANAKKEMNMAQAMMKDEILLKTVEDQIVALTLAIKEMRKDGVPEAVIEPSFALLNVYRKQRKNAQQRIRYRTDIEYQKKQKAHSREEMKLYNTDPEWRAAQKIRVSNNNRQRYCCEDISNIENYEKAKADNFKSWDIHHRLQTHKYSDRTRTSWTRRDEDVPRKTLIALGLYYNRPAKELIFLPEADHIALHTGGVA